MSERAGSAGSAFWADADEAEALQRYRTLVNTIDDGIYQLDTEGRFVAVNNVIVRTTGYARDELVDEHVSLVLDTDDVSTIEREIGRRLTGCADRNETFEIQVRTAEGSRVPCELRLNLLVEDGSFQGSIGVVRDISDRKRTERTLTERERQLQRENDLTARILETSPVGITVFDSDGSVTHVNERAEELLGVSGGRRGTFPPTERRTYDENGRPIAADEHPFARAIATGEPVYDRVVQVEWPDGGRRWLSVSAAPILTDDGEVDHVVTTAEDITDIKERERKLESELSEVFGRVTDAFYALDDRWRISYANDRAEELIDYTDEGLVGRDFWEVFEWATDSTLGEEYRTAMEAQEPTSFEFYYPDPLEAWYEVHAYPSETGLSVYFRDVTERKRRERQLEESERRYRTLVEHFPNGAVALVDENLHYQTVGGSPLDVADVPVHEVEGRPVAEALPPKLADELVPRYEAAFEGESDSFEVETDGRTYQFQVVPVRDDDGDVFAALGMSQNITEQKEHERYLQDAKSQLEAATEAGAVGTWEWHVPEDRMVAGSTFARTFGIEPDAAREGVSLDRFISAIHEDDRERVERAVENVLASCGEYEAEYRVWNADDELRWVVARGRVECDEDGNPVRFPGAVADITERKRAERALQEREKQLETLFDVLPVGVVVADGDGSLVEANDAAKELCGGDVFDAESIADYDRYRGWWAETGELVEPDEWTMARVLRGEEVTEPDVYEIEAADGERRIVMAHGMPVREASGEVARGVITLTDITERREYQRRLEESERRYRTLAENFPNGAVGVYDYDLRYTLTQGAVLGDELPGRDQLEGKTVSEVFPSDTVGDLEPVFRAAVEDGETGSTTTEFGGRHWRVWAAPLRDASGDIFAGLSFTQDITEQVERERKLEETVEKLEASNERLESFASMLAHELRNPVTIGQIYSQQLPVETAPKAVEYVAEAFDRIEDMIDIMLMMTRGCEAIGESGQVRIADAARDAWDGLDAPERTLQIEIDGEVPTDETYIRHLFRNLFENAVQHGGEDVTVEVGELSNGFYVADDGRGIPTDDRNAVFEAGYTTAANNGGTGLGLAFVEEMADAYGWDCAVTESAEGGARFEFRNVDIVPAE